MRVGSVVVATCLLLGAWATTHAANTNPQGERFSESDHVLNNQGEASKRGFLSNEQRADIFMARKEYDKAVDYFERALLEYRGTYEASEKIPGVWNKMGIGYQRQMEFRKARKAYKKAIDLRPDFGEAWNNLGTTFYLEKKVKKSIHYYQRAIKLEPQSASFHLNLGTAYFARKKYPKAYGEYHTAIALNPDILDEYSPMGTEVETRRANAEFYFYMAKVFASLGRPAEAIRYLQRAMEEGFTDRNRILKDPDIKKISADPGFVSLMKSPPTPIKD
jgi:tetratricopeptide (TPR) repeat protein